MASLVDLYIVFLAANYNGKCNIIMYKTTSKTSLFLASCMLSIILLSLVSSVILYRQIDNLQTGAVNTDTVDFINEFELELMNTSELFSGAYKADSLPKVNQEFDRHFSNIVDRTTGFVLLEQQYPDLNEKINVALFSENISRIQEIVYDQASSGKYHLFQAQHLFSELIVELHNFQKNWGYHNQDMLSTKQRNTLLSFQNSVLLIFVTFIVGILMVIYLFSNNRKLLDLQRTLEKRVYVRTKELNNSNSNLLLEIKERQKTEEALTKSRLAAELAHKKIQHQNNFDALTKLANRNLFMESFNDASKRADRNKTLVGVLFLDLDRFKYVDDTLGHSIGDDLLKEAALRIQDVLRSTDTAARFGGDEFAVVLSDIDQMNTVELIVGRILKTLVNPFRLSGNDAFVSASIGISMYPTDGDNYETLIRKADSAMYKAKDAGSNNYQFFTQQMDLEASERRLLEASLYKAVEEKQFSLEYQPVYAANNSKISAFESLIFWNHATQGKISADKFIPLAEEIGLILPIGQWMLSQACEAASLWLKGGSESFIMSVNISSRQFQNCDMAQQIDDVLNETGLEAKYLMIEITESLLIFDNKQTLEQLKKIRKMGVRIAIDDFGTGYSSLSFLKKYPITTLKLDKSIIAEINIDLEDNELIKGIISMAANLNLNVIAEGVETKEQAAFLVENSCGFIQGKYFSPPVSSDKILDILHTAEQKIVNSIEEGVLA